MSILKQAFVKDFIRMCGDGWDLDWHERNTGNLSYRMTGEDAAAVRAHLDFSGAWTPVGVALPGLGGEFFLITGSNKFFRNVREAPEDCICVIELDSAGVNYRICWGLKSGGRPTSEMPTHLMVHEVKKRSGNQRVIYHAHPANCIALTFVLPLDDIVFTRELWEMMAECPVVFPGGVAVVPWQVPGSIEAAVETAARMEECDVAFWSHHGMFCSGEGFDVTFGLMHTVEKAAEILVKVRAMGGKRQALTPDLLRACEEPFGLKLPERFLAEPELPF